VAANVLTIHGGHTLDMLGRVLGRPGVRGATMWTAVPEFLVDTGERLPRDAPDNLVAVLDYDGVVAVTQFSHTGPNESFELEIYGTGGMLRRAAGRQRQLGGLTLTVTDFGSRTPRVVEPPPDLPYASPLPADHPGHNMASVYAALADVIATGRPAAGAEPADFRTAVETHSLLELIAAQAVDSTVSKY